MKKILGIPWALLLIGVATATIFSGTVVAYLNLVNEIDYGKLKTAETKTKILGSTNSTINAYNLNFSTTCLGSETITARLTYYSGDVFQNPTLNLNGTTVIDKDIDAGTINITITGQRMGRFNCTIEPIANFTEISFVESI